jgi:hypothetical protein
MFSGAEEHVIYQIANAPIRAYPFPHIYAESVFPQNFYDALRKQWPDSSQFVSLDSTGRVPKGAYPERFIMPLRQTEVDKLPGESRAFWTAFAGWLLTGRFLYALLDKFDDYVRERFGPRVADCSFSSESLVVRDYTNYKIGPHTDAPHRLLSLLFYCPDDSSLKHLGTSIYVPRDPAFRCPGGPHHPHNLFNKVATMEYKPNTLFAFVKTDRSFHGVDPIGDADVLRDLLLYDIRVELEPRVAAETSASGTSSLGIRMLKHLFGGRHKS